MAIDNVDRRLEQARRPGFGIGLLKGMRVLLKHLVKHNSVIQYPDVKQDLSSRTRGVIALKEENCTVCMLCARECPDWCIYIDSHKETLPPKREGGRPRKRNVLDRFAIDYALCMYCGICVEVCPYDALFWSREFEYSEYDIRQLTHEKERLSDWMATVLAPPELEFGAELPGQPAAAASAPAPAPTQPATAARPATTTSSAAETRPQQAVDAPKAGTAAPTDSKPATATPDAATAPAPETAKPTDAPPARALTEETKAEQMDSGATAEPEAAKQIDDEGKVAAEGSQAEVESAPAPPPAPVRPAPKLEDLEDPEAAYKRVIDEQSKAQSSPQVAQARAKVARVKAERAIAQATAAAATSEPPAEPKPSGAPEAKEPAPEQGPVAPTTEEQAEASTPEPTPEPPKAEASGEDPDAVFERVLEEERAKGSSDAVANARAKAARMRAIKGSKGPGAR
jgi:formate hydrogenlyase subunit 6/NADH:ubiquinone oxidoreductase subunit I